MRSKSKGDFHKEHHHWCACTSSKNYSNAQMISLKVLLVLLWYAAVGYLVVNLKLQKECATKSKGYHAFTVIGTTCNILDTYKIQLCMTGENIGEKLCIKFCPFC